MAESGIQQSLVTPRGTLRFNNPAVESGGTSGVLMIYNIDGLDGPDLRTSTDLRPQRPGLLIHPFFDGARNPVLVGRILPLDLSNAVHMQDEIRAATDSIKDTDGRYTFSPNGQSERFITVRLGDSVTIEDDPLFAAPAIIKKFTIPLIAGDPTVYTLTETDTTIGSGATVSVPNNGNAKGWPVLRVNGPVTGFRVTNNNTGLFLEFSGLSIAAGHLVEIIMREETAYKDRNQADQLFGLNMTTSNFWWLEPGSNSVTFNNITGGDGSETVLVLSNDAWA